MESRRELQMPRRQSAKRRPQKDLQPPESNQDREARSTNIDQSHALKRKLIAQHLSIIALGGALGTGLIIDTGPALARGSPAAILIAYDFLGLSYTWCYSGLLGMLRDTSILQWASHLAIASLVLQYWVPRAQVNPGVWIAIFLVVIVLFNFFGVKFFGELEFYLSALKIVIVVGPLVLSVVVVSGGG
ncbi:hypothetical protein BDZ45DRAFT_798474 [Acephala macrosclerotiorum]|nr:hypothetical protein BDZ45DRAFT_798474 [Acephala macrosclerotiorum]